MKWTRIMYELCHFRNGTAVRASDYPIFLVLSYRVFSLETLTNVSSIIMLSIDELKAMRKVGPIAYLTQDSKFSFFYMSYAFSLSCFLNRIASTRVSLYLLRYWPSFFLFFESLMINLTNCGD